MQSNPRTALVLGARGRLGRLVTEEFARRGWAVRALARSLRGAAFPDGVVPVEADARSPRDLIVAAEGADVIVNATNPSFRDWDPALFEIAEAVIAATRSSGAAHLYAGNVYNYGWPVPEVIRETVAQRPSTRKGAIRVEVERRYREAADLHGARTVVIRAGDFYGGPGRGSWFDLVLAERAGNGRMVYPGPPNLPHSWAYLPDLAACFVALARQRDDFGRFETFHFPGHTATGEEMAAAFQAALGRRITVGRMPWRTIRLGATFVRSWRELSELAYLWHVPHRLDGAKLEMAIGDLPATPFRRAVRDSLDVLGLDTRPGNPGTIQLVTAQ